MRRSYIIWALVAAVAALLIVTGHGPHAIGYLPFLILLACPLMHMFMHRGHGGHGGEYRRHRARVQVKVGRRDRETSLRRS